MNIIEKYRAKNRNGALSNHIKDIKFFVEALRGEGAQQINPKGLPSTKEGEPFIVSQCAPRNGLN